MEAKEALCKAKKYSQKYSILLSKCPEGSDFSSLSLGPGPSASTAAVDCFGTRAGMQIGLGAMIRGSGNRVRSAVDLPLEISLIEECVASEEDGNAEEAVDVWQEAMGLLPRTVREKGGKMKKEKIAVS